jgi:hypothetical protein
LPKKKESMRLAGYAEPHKKKSSDDRVSDFKVFTPSYSLLIANYGFFSARYTWTDMGLWEATYVR